MDSRKIWETARAGDGGAVEVDGLVVPLETVAALRALPAPGADGVIVTFGKARDRRLVEVAGVVKLEVV